MWAFRGLPGGTMLFWMAPFPLFAAGLALGPAVAVGGALLAVVLLAVVGGGTPVLVFLALFGLPVPLLLLAAFRHGGVTLDLPLALLGLWPCFVLLLAALFLADDGGLEPAMRRAVELALARLGLPAPETMVAELVRVKAAAIGFWSSLALLANAAAAERFLARRGLLAVPAPDWTAARLPRWYPLLPAVAAGLLLASPEGGDAVPLSGLLILLVPLFLQGCGGVHARLRGSRARLPMLALFYMLLLLFLQMMGPGLVGLGLYDQFRRRPAPRNS
ncbi:hypothetical protein ACFQY5_28280 [Paeniroseomonas aquatica]|uniref:DUF2232 domain-containing protein n=1 Tax=Paeniroseomonas aquatica TaxID=373043 RepID=A0ABT8AEF1_9PROT|nr:hypothetical protein [Paeniroseomonas aquatica]MDN3568207.1 hypothetical protein [Paeniroseomonas aquatica]